MPVSLSVKVDGVKELQAFLAGYAKQLPFATSKALNDTAFQVRDAEKQEILGVFDNPVPFVRRSPKVEKSSKRNLSARVYIDERVQDSLTHQVEGGARLPRDVARKLRRAGHLKAGEFTTYNSDYTNARGNITLARWKKILLELRKTRGQYFVATIKGLKAIWIRKGRGGRQIAPVVLIVKRAPRYRKRFDFYGEAERTFHRHFERNFDQALARAIRTVR